MNTTWQRTTKIMILLLSASMLAGCTSMYPNETPFPALATPVPAQAGPVVVLIESPNRAYELAQATKDAGQNQLLDLARKSTEVSLAMAQAAKSAAQSTQDYNQRRKLDLDFQATLVSLNIAQAVATQKFITNQTKSAGEAMAALQTSAAAATQSAFHVNETRAARTQTVLDEQAALTAQARAALTAYPLTATYAAYLINLTETVQAQEFLNAQALQAAQAEAALTAYPLTATPYAKTQAALLMQQYGREQQSFVNQIVAPLLPILSAIALGLLILVIIVAYRRFMAKSAPGRFWIGRGTGGPAPLLTIDGVMMDPAPLPDPLLPPPFLPADPPPLPAENSARVEIYSPTDAPVAHWIAEVEQQMTIDEGLQI